MGPVSSRRGNPLADCRDGTATPATVTFSQLMCCPRPRSKICSTLSRCRAICGGQRNHLPTYWCPSLCRGGHVRQRERGADAGGNDPAPGDGQLIASTRSCRTPPMRLADSVAAIDELVRRGDLDGAGREAHNLVSTVGSPGVAQVSRLARHFEMPVRPTMPRNASLAWLSCERPSPVCADRCATISTAIEPIPCDRPYQTTVRSLNRRTRPGAPRD
jgi:hypothetical protein